MTKTDTTPIVMLTLQDLRDVIREEMGSSVNATHESKTLSASEHISAKLAGKEKYKLFFEIASTIQKSLTTATH